MEEILRLCRRKNISWLESGRLAADSRIRHGFGFRWSFPPQKDTRRAASEDGNLCRRVFAKNREFLTHLKVDNWELATLPQIHSDTSFEVSRQGNHKLILRPLGSKQDQWTLLDNSAAGDALVTDEPGILLAVRTADCMPILLLDPARPRVAAIHAGWRGTLSRVMERVARRMDAGEAPEPSSIAVIGPCIQKCCFAVGEEVFAKYRAEFSNAEDFFARPGASPRNHSHQTPSNRGLWHLDLPRMAREQLRAAGFSSDSIFASSFCTRCRQDLFFSYRGEPAGTGRMLTVIGIGPKESHVA